MMDIRPLILSPGTLNPSRDLKPLYTVFATQDDPTMIIDTTSHSSSMSVSPKQGEIVAVDSFTKEEPHLASSSLSPKSWELISSQQKAPSIASSIHTSTVLSQSWTTVSPRFSFSPGQMTTDTFDHPGVDTLQTEYVNSETLCDSWIDSKDILKSGPTLSPKSSSPHHLLSPSVKRDENEEIEEPPTVTLSASKISPRNCDRADSSPSPQSQFNSSFDKSKQAGTGGRGQNVEILSTSNIGQYGNLERRSRRKPTVGDIVRCVRPPVDAPPYSSEDSEIEDDILEEETMTKIRSDEQVHEISKSSINLNSNGIYREEDSRQLTMDRFTRLEAVDGTHKDDEEMEMQSEADSIDESDKHAFLKDVPLSIYNLMHEAKVNAHMTFMKTSNNEQPIDAKVWRERYLIQLLSNLKNRCLEERLKPEIIGSVLKDVETEVMYLCEDLEDMKMKQFFSGLCKEYSFTSTGVHEDHFLSKQEVKTEDVRDKRETSKLESLYSSTHPPSFFTTTSTSSSSNSSSPSSNSKPIIMTVSADIKPPVLYSRGSVPQHHPLTSKISDHGFNSMFSSGKLSTWFPPDLPMYYLPNCPGPLDFPSKFWSLDGKIGENLDKDYLKCQFCERTFRRQKNLENHIENTHQGKGPLKPRRDNSDMYFKCSHCPYTTKHQSNLYVHLRIHTGERPYICGACGVQYSQSHSLKSHIINKHDGIMSYYIKEKRTRSPRGMGYLSTQIMHDNGMIKLSGPFTDSPMHHNLNIVNKVIHMATSETAKHQEQLKYQQQNIFPSDTDVSGLKSMMPPPLSAIISNGNNNSTINGNSNAHTSNIKSPATANSGLGSDHNTPTPNSMFSSPGVAPHLPFFMSGQPLMFGELPPHIHNSNHLAPGHYPPTSHSFFSGFHQFPPNSSRSFIGTAGLSPLSGTSPTSSPALSTENSHQNLPPHFQIPISMPHISQSPSSSLQQQQIKKELQSIPITPIFSKQSPKRQSDEAIDLRKKSPSLETKEHHAYDLNICGGKENCPHAAKLKFLRLNVVRMLGILVPNLNFAEKGISAESESIDELLQDVIESNTHDDDSSE